MEYIIRKIAQKDKAEVISMMTKFYESPCVATNGSSEIFNADLEACISDNPYLEGYVFESENDILGYAMLAKSFSTEYGKPCIWVEDLYIKEAFRGLGIGSRFFGFIEEKYKHTIFRLEVEEENTRAINVYKKAGYDFMPYKEMKK
ncbi:MAG: GNAT family N-acetyltransferase [Ruminococcaceae bacterium]|nr:GNAT family N-acetyltransferase [Oscillospiraceae bacterium]